MDIENVSVFLQHGDNVIELGSYDIETARKVVSLFSAYEVRVLDGEGGELFEYAEPTLVYKDGKVWFELTLHETAPAFEPEADEY